jgi:hypothetical protein
MTKEKESDYLLFKDVDKGQFEEVKKMLKGFELKQPVWHLQNRNGDYIPVRLDRGNGKLMPAYMPNNER